MKKFLMLIGSVLAVVALSLALPFTGLLLPDSASAQNQSAEQAITDAQKGFGSDANPRSNFWRAVREGNVGTSQVKSTDANILINGNGQNWRAIRNGPVFYWGWIGFAVVAGAVLLFWLLRGRVKLTDGMSGVKVKRWGGVLQTLALGNGDLFHLAFGYRTQSFLRQGRDDSAAW